MMKIILIDDEINLLKTVKTYLEIKGFKVFTESSGQKGLDLILNKEFDAVLLDLFLSEKDQGFELLKRIKEERPKLPVIIISGHGSVESAVKAIQLGAYDFLEKPINTEKLEIQLRNALNTSQLNKELGLLKQQWLEKNFIIGPSQTMKNVMTLAEKYAPLNHSVLICGGNGTGKELLSRYIYQNSLRSGQTFLAVNCAAIPVELFDSQLFGHKKGAFTGAHKDHKGFFEEAHQGTLFLDEVAEIPLTLQAKLLRALENGEVQVVGGARSVNVDVRLICATNRDLREEIDNGRFREDLFFRISQLEIKLPSLEDRKEDIPFLVRHFIEKEKENMMISNKAMEYFQKRKYPGNIRELKNLILRIIVMAKGNKIEKQELESVDHGYDSIKNDQIFENTMELKKAKKILELIYLKRQLELHNDSVKDTAEALGILPNNLSRRLGELDGVLKDCI